MEIVKNGFSALRSRIGSRGQLLGRNGHAKTRCLPMVQEDGPDDRPRRYSWSAALPETTTIFSIRKLMLGGPIPDRSYREFLLENRPADLIDLYPGRIIPPVEYQPPKRMVHFAIPHYQCIIFSAWMIDQVRRTEPKVNLVFSPTTSSSHFALNSGDVRPIFDRLVRAPGGYVDTENDANLLHNATLFYEFAVENKYACFMAFNSTAIFVNDKVIEVVKSNVDKFDDMYESIAFSNYFSSSSL